VSKKTYYDKLDVIKGFAIILVILGHCIQCGSGIIVFSFCSIMPEYEFLFLKEMGQESGGIYILQTWANAVMIRFLHGVNHSVLLNVVEAGMVCCVCYFGVKAISRNSFLALILFGKRGA